MTASNCSGTIKWSTGASGSSITVSTAGTYSAVCSNICGDSPASNVVTITTGSKPNAPTVSTDKTICCDGAKATLTASGCVGSVTWSNGASGSTIQVSVAGTYTATCTNVCGSSSASSGLIIKTGDSPTVPTVVASKTSLCASESATLTASNCNGTVKWSTNATGNVITVSTAGTYTAVCETICGVSNASVPVVITTGSKPNAPSILANKTSLCEGESATLTASNCSGTIKWSTGASGSSITVSTAGTYSAVCSNICGDSPASNVVTITTGSKPNAPTVTASKTALCGTETATLTASGCTGSLLWSNSSTGSTITVSMAGTYTATCSNSCGASPASTPIVITVGSVPNAPTVTASKTALCGTETATLTASGCTGNLLWSNSSTGSTITVSTAGTYTATCSNSCGASPASTPIVITVGSVPNAPTVTASKTALCGTETATLTASGCTGSLLWSNSSTGSSITVSTAGTYTATCSNSCGASPASTPIVITVGSVPNAPTVTASKTALCGIETATLTASGCTGNLLWSNSSTGSSITVSTAGTYTATCSNSCGASPASTPIVITVGSVPNAPTVTASKTALCGTETATLTASGCTGNLLWSNSSTGSSITVSTAGTYTATCSNSCGASPASTPIVITVGSVPNAPTVTASKTALCGTETATLTASGCTGNLLWSNSSTGSSITVSTAGTYTATCSNSCGVSPASTPIVITVGSVPNAPTVTASKTALCGTETATLTASGCTGNLLWSNSSTGSSITVSTAGTYTATCSNSCGASPASTPIVITVGSVPNAPTVTANKTALCGTETATLTASGCTGNLLWSNSSTGSTITVSTAGTYTATCSNSCGASPASTPIVITVGSVPNAPSVTADKNSLCNGEVAKLTATNCGGIIKWSNSSTGSTINVSTAGSYTAVCSNSCGDSPASNVIVITVGSKPSAPTVVASKTSICGDESATLTASNCSSAIRWITGATTSSITVTVGGTYTATCTNSCGESESSTPVVIQKSGTPPAPIITTDKPNACDTEKATLTATGCTGGVVRWSTGETGTSIKVDIGTYTAICTNNCGESGLSNPVSILKGGTPQAPSVTASKTSLCGTETATLTATGCVGTINWSNSSTGSSITVSTAGTYTATCSNSCGTSTASNPIVITTGALPTAPSIIASKTSLCGTETATLTATGCTGTVKWSTNATGSSITVSTAGSYSAVCVGSCGDSPSSNVVIITIGGAPAAPSITANKTSLCGTETATLTATGCTGTVKWSTNATGSSITVSTAGSYSAVCVGSCSDSPSSNVVVITVGGAPAAPSITASKTSLCGTETATLTATGCAGTVKWSTNATSSTITVSTSGTYTATCTNACGTSPASTPVVISTGTVPSAPSISTNKNSLCNGETATLTATNCGGAIKWSTNATSSVITVSTAGTYTAVCSNACGDSQASNAVIITVGTAPNAPTVTASSTSICGTESVTLTASNCSGTIRWNTSATTSAITVSVGGSYTATCTTNCGESPASTPVVIQKGGTPPAPIITTDRPNACDTEKATLTATGCTGGIVKWSTGETGTSIKVEIGTYTAICTNACGESGLSNPVSILKGGTPTAPVVTANKQSVCGDEANLTATGCSGTVKWNTNATGSTLTVTTAGTYTATCTNSCGTSQASVPVTISTGATPAAPTIVSDKSSICGSEVATLTATGCSGTVRWSTNVTGTSITVTTAGTYTATCANACGTSQASTPVVISTSNTASKPVIASNKTTICGDESATLTATGCTGTVRWSNNTTGTSITVTTVGTYTATCTNSCGTSPASNPVVISTGTATSAPVITVDKTEICENQTAVLTATGCSGTIRWSNNSTGSSITVSTAGTYTATCTSSCGTSPASNSVVIRIKTQGCTGCTITAPVIAASKSAVCKPENITLTATNCANKVVWSTGETGSSITVKPSVTTSYSAVCTDGDKCTSGLSNSVQVKVGTVSIPLVVCNSDVVCKGEPVTLKAYGCDGTVVWSNGLTGNEVIVTPTDSISRYSSYCKLGDCISKNSDTLKVVVGLPAAPIISCKSAVLCFGASETLTATGCNGQIVWSSGQTGAVITVSPSVNTTYTAVCQSAGGKCVSVKSNEITIKPAPRVTKPTVIAELKNTCPFVTVDLNKAITGDPSTDGGAFEFHTTNSSSSALITNPGAAGAGEYWVFERSALGCYSDGSKVTVKIDTCSGGVTPVGDLADISVKKTVASKIVPVNEMASYRVVVKNNGPKTATNVIVRDILPAGLTFASSSINAKFENGIVQVKIDSLKNGDSTVFTYMTKVGATGKIVNKAELFRLDQTDNTLANNSSTVTINDLATGPLLGLSKVCEEAKQVKERIYDIPFTIFVTNMGNTDLSNLQVIDDLDKAFGNGVKFIGDTIKVTADSGLVVNPRYSGRGLNTALLNSAQSSLKKGKKAAIKFTVRVDLKDVNINQFFNSAEGTSSDNQGLVVAKDKSTDGTNPDPDGDGDPTNNDLPSPISIKLDQNPNAPAIGVALSIVDSVANTNGSYDVMYMAIIKNVGNALLKNIQLTDSLEKCFPDTIDFQLVGKPTLKTGSTLKVNPDFNGKSDVNMLIADSTAQLAVGKQDTVMFTVKIFNNGSPGPFKNQVIAKGIGNGTLVTDLSNDGVEVKVNVDSPTLLRLPTLSEKDVIIPGGFSPNGDGVNDSWKLITNGTVTLESCEIYNRWGHLVYKESDKSNALIKDGWDGKSNQGIRFGTEGLPDGTYYYVIKVQGENESRIGYLTLIR
ncbi:MAG: gliding motility-associated C-terminal domain-containing protein [Spirosomataceae bacterium]